jgi:polycystin 1L2
LTENFKNSVSFCNAELSVLNTEKTNYDFNWTQYSSAYTTDVYKAFQYTKALSISSYPMSGVYTSYLGGGYVFKMNGNSTELVSNFTFLEKNNWIDRQTRALFVEFNLFNPNINMFAYCYLLFEFLPTGSIVASFRFSPMTLFDSRNSLYSFGTVCAIIYLVMIFVLTMKQIYRIKVTKCKYFKQMWTYLDLSLIAFSYTSFAIWLYRIWEAQRIMSWLASPNGRFINLQMLAYWDDVLASMLAFCACLGSLKFFKILQINRSIQTLTRTIQIGFVNFAGFGFIFALMVFAWLQVGFIIFNDSVAGFSTFVKTIETGFLLILGKIQLNQMLNVNPFFGATFHITFNFFMVIIMLHMFMSLITDAFAIAKEDEKKLDELHLESFIYGKIKASFEYFINKFSSKRKERQQVENHERQMRHSLAQKDLYQDQFTNFDYKVGIFVSTFNYFGTLNSKDNQRSRLVLVFVL